MSTRNLSLVTLVLIPVFLIDGILLGATSQTTTQGKQGSQKDDPSREELIRRLGGKVIYDKEGDNVKEIAFDIASVSDESIVILAKFPEIEALNLESNPDLTTQGIKVIAKLKKLRRLNIAGTNIDSSAGKELSKLPELEELYAFRTDVTDQFLEYLAGLPRLRLLNVWDTATTDEGLDHLSRLKSLKLLHVGNSPKPFRAGDTKWDIAVSKITKAGIDRLRKKLPGLKVIHWSPGSPSAPEFIARSKSDPSRTRKFVDRESVIQIEKLSVKKHRWLRNPSRFLGPDRNAKIPAERVYKDWEKNPPRLVWRIRLGEGYSSCAVTHERFYAFDRQGESDRLLCGDRKTGKMIWETKFPTDFVDAAGYGNGPRATPVIEGVRIYTYAADGMLRCQSLLDGRLIWQVDTAADFQPTLGLFGVSSTPLVYKDKLLVVVGNQTGDKRPGQVLVAFDKLTGEVIYKSGQDRSSYASPKVVDLSVGKTCLVFARDGLNGFSPDNGKLIFQFPWHARVSGCVNAAMPVVVNDNVLVTEAYGAGSALIDVDKKGEVRTIWKDSIRSRSRSLRSHWSTPVVVEGMVYGAHGRHTHNASIRCIDFLTGKVEWEEMTHSICSLTLVDGCLLAIGEYGQMRLIEPDKKKYREVANVKLQEQLIDNRPMVTFPVWAPPVISRGQIFIRGRQELVCLEIGPE